MNDVYYKPMILAAQYSLPFTQLDPHRFEQLCLSVLVLEFGLTMEQHIGKAARKNNLNKLEKFT
jgi:hypothetical protein